jgi:hypothetical protein
MEGRLPLHDGLLLEVAAYLGVRDVLSLVQVGTFFAGDLPIS